MTCPVLARVTVCGTFRDTWGLTSIIHFASASPIAGQIESPATLQPLAKYNPQANSEFILQRSDTDGRL